MKQKRTDFDRCVFYAVLVSSQALLAPASGMMIL